VLAHELGELGGGHDIAPVERGEVDLLFDREMRRECVREAREGQLRRQHVAACQGVLEDLVELIELMVLRRDAQGFTTQAQVEAIVV
jgi:hypothetical protein